MEVQAWTWTLQLQILGNILNASLFFAMMKSATAFKLSIYRVIEWKLLNMKIILTKLFGKAADFACCDCKNHKFLILIINMLVSQNVGEFHLTLMMKRMWCKECNSMSRIKSISWYLDKQIHKNVSQNNVGGVSFNIDIAKNLM